MSDMLQAKIKPFHIPLAWMRQNQSQAKCDPGDLQLGSFWVFFSKKIKGAGGAC